MFKSLLARLDDPTSTPALVRRLLVEYGAVRWKAYTTAFAFLAVAAGCTAAMAYLVGDIINQAYINRDFSAVLQVSILVVLVCVARGFSSYIGSVSMSRIGNSVIAENQRLLFAALMRQNIAYFSDRHSSEMLARLTTGANASKQALNLIINSLGRDALTLIGLVAVMLVQDPWMAMFTFVVAPPILLALRRLRWRVRQVAQHQWVGNAQSMETMQETVQGLRIVKSFTLEDKMGERFGRNVATVEAEANTMSRVSNRMAPLMETLGGIVIGAAMVYSGYRVIYTGATPGEFLSFMMAFLFAYEPAKRLARVNIELNAAMVGVRILFDVIDNKAGDADAADAPPLHVTDARVSFENVDFSYVPGSKVLHALSLNAEPGRMTALAGPSGGGKSTILNLILRLYDADAGSVTIDGQDVRTVSRQSLRRQIAFVGQDVFLFRTTIRENIAYGRPNATEAEIVAAAKAAQAHDFITALRDGYDTQVGERGLQLSGGERQRVAIARALVKDAPIILLDEATASLDSQSERLVQEAIAELCKGRTTIVIAHRLSTIMHADNILVVEGGRIVESGRHDELLRKGGRYAAFYRLQLKQQEADEPVALAVGR